jgi:hypothetical protein
VIKYLGVNTMLLLSPSAAVIGMLLITLAPTPGFVGGECVPSFYKPRWPDYNLAMGMLLSALSLQVEPSLSLKIFCPLFLLSLLPNHVRGRGGAEGHWVLSQQAHQGDPLHRHLQA